MALIDKITNIADKIRILLGMSDGMTLVGMSDNLGEAVNECDTQAELIQQIKTTLEGKATGVELPSLDNPGAESDLAAGKELIDATGKKVPGTLPSPDSFTKMNSAVNYDATSKNISLSASVDTDIILRTGKSVDLSAEGSAFGDVKPEEVLAGKFFTSENGLNVPGTLVPSSSSGGDDGSFKAVIERTAENVTLPANLTSIGQYAFYGCFNLALTSLPEGITSIGQYAFYSCLGLALTSLPEGITSIGSYAFYSCKNLALTSLPEGITSIGQSAFYGCPKLALTSLPEGITNISGSAFYNCSKLALTSLPEGITSIGSSAFYGCTSLALTSLPEGLTTIGSRSFDGCISLALTSLPAGITTIESTTFQSCRNLAITSIPASVQKINSSAFAGCDGLTEITFESKPTSISSNAFTACNNLLVINVPWAEDEVANAPWGAKNATINYNYTGG